MKRPLIALALLPFAALSLAAPGVARERPLPGGPRANPGAVVAAELGFAKLAQDKGQWTAFVQTAAKDAVMFVPQMVLAQQWLKGRANPASAVKWQPHQVWSSCDGSLAVTRGAWQGAGDKSGYFTTVWQRQKNGKFKWVVDQAEPLPMPIDAPEMIVSKVAECPAPGVAPPPAPRGKAPLPPFDPAQRSGQSTDGTLRWEVKVAPDGARSFAVDLLLDGKLTPVQVLEVPAPEG